MAALTYFTVTGTFLAVGSTPTPMTGRITFTPLVDRGDVITADALTPPASLMLEAVSASVRADGQVKTGDTLGVQLVANTAVLELEGELYYRVDFYEGLKAGTKSFHPSSFTFQAPTTSTTIDLTTVVPIAGSSASQISRGPKGDPVDDFTIDGDGNLQFFVDSQPIGEPQALPAASWGTIANKPPVVAAGATQAEARTAIGAVDTTALAGKYTKPAPGIPTTDLATAVQTSLGKADTAYQAPAVVGAGATQAEARTAIGAQSSIVFNVKDFGVKGDGTTDDATALQAALDAMPSGATLLFPPGRYLTTAALVSTGKTLNIEAYGATLVRGGTGSALAVEGAFDATIGVSALANTTTSVEEATGVLTTTLTLASAPGWVRGDLVKLVADDEIPGVRPLDGSTLQRVGQHFFVQSCTGTTAVLVGRLRDPFTTNIRVARMRQLTTRINGLHIESPAGAGFSGTGNYVRVSKMVRPRVNVTMGSFPATGLAFKGCYAPQCNLVVDCANDAPLGSQFGYALNDGGSEFGVFNVVAANVRHAYTDGSSVIAAGETDLSSYGRPYGHVVSGTAYGTLATAWDTHNSAKGIVFRNCQAYDCQGGFALRGVECSVIGGVVNDCSFGIYVFDEDGKNGVTSKDSYSYGHYIDGLIIRRPKLRAIDVTANLDGPLVNVRESRPTTIRNVTVIDCTADDGFVVRAANQTVVIDNLHVVSPAVVTAHALVRTVNSEVQLSNFTADYRAHTSGAVQHVYDTNSTFPSTVAIKSFDVKLTTAAAALVSVAFAGQAGTHWEIAQCDFTQPVAAVINTSQFDASSAFRWLNKSDGTNEAYQSAGSSIENTASVLRMFLSNRPLIVIRCAPGGSNRTVAKLGSGNFLGQELMILNTETSSGNTVTVVHSTTTRLTSNLGSANVVLGNSQYAKWMWTGTYWTQILAPTPLTIGQGRIDPPADYNDLIGWTMDPALVATPQIVPAAATIHFARIPLREPKTINNVLLRLNALGATLTHSYVAVFKSDGTLLGQSADQSTDWASGSLTNKTIPLTSPAFAAPTTPNDFVWAAIYVGTAGTLPTFTRGTNSAQVNMGLPSSRLRFATAALADTASLTNVTPSSMTSSSNPWIMGIS